MGSTQKKLDSSIKTLKKTIKLKSYRRLALNFLILSINLLAIILYFSLSQAKIIITPQEEVADFQIQIPIAQNEEQETDNNIKVSVLEVEVSENKSFDANDKKFAPAQSEGELTIFNTSSIRNQTLVENTQFIGQDGAIIRIKETVRLTPGETATVSAYADKTGEEGQAKQGRYQIVKLPYLNDIIYGEVAKDFTGGVIETGFISNSLFVKSKEEIEKSLQEKALNELAKNNSLIDFGQINIDFIDYTTNAQPGDENVVKLDVGAKARASALVFDTNKALEIVKKNLIQNITPNKIFINIVADSFKAEIDDENNVLTAYLEARVRPKISQYALEKQDIIGKNQEEIQNHFEKISGISKVDVHFSPFWVKKAPNLKDHIDIEIK